MELSGGADHPGEGIGAQDAPSAPASLDLNPKPEAPTMVAPRTDTSKKPLYQRPGLDDPIPERREFGAGLPSDSPVAAAKIAGNEPRHVEWNGAEDNLADRRAIHDQWVATEVNPPVAAANVAVASSVGSSTETENDTTTAEKNNNGSKNEGNGSNDTRNEGLALGFGVGGEKAVGDGAIPNGQRPGNEARDTVQPTAEEPKTREDRDPKHNAHGADSDSLTEPQSHQETEPTPNAQAAAGPAPSGATDSTVRDPAAATEPRVQPGPEPQATTVAEEPAAATNADQVVANEPPTAEVETPEPPEASLPPQETATPQTIANVDSTTDVQEEADRSDPAALPDVLVPEEPATPQGDIEGQSSDANPDLTNDTNTETETPLDHRAEFNKVREQLVADPENPELRQRYAELFEPEVTVDGEAADATIETPSEQSEQEAENPSANPYEKAGSDQLEGMVDKALLQGLGVDGHELRQMEKDEYWGPKIAEARVKLRELITNAEQEHRNRAESQDQADQAGGTTETGASSETAGEKPYATPRSDSFRFNEGPTIDEIWEKLKQSAREHGYHFDEFDKDGFDWEPKPQGSPDAPGAQAETETPEPEQPFDPQRAAAERTAIEAYISRYQNPYQQLAVRDYINRLPLDSQARAEILNRGYQEQALREPDAIDAYLRKHDQLLKEALASPDDNIDRIIGRQIIGSDGIARTISEREYVNILPKGSVERASIIADGFRTLAEESARKFEAEQQFEQHENLNEGEKEPHDPSIQDVKPVPVMRVAYEEWLRSRNPALNVTAGERWLGAAGAVGHGIRAVWRSTALNSKVVKVTPVGKGKGFEVLVKIGWGPFARTVSKWVPAKTANGARAMGYRRALLE